MQSKPYAPAAERNRQPILDALRELIPEDSRILEFGSGTGQHACFVASAMPCITWQPTDLEPALPGIRRWIAESGCHNIRDPEVLDLGNPPLDLAFQPSVCFTANTLHIVSWPLVENLFRYAFQVLDVDGLLCIYGPFQLDGRHTSEGNALFDRRLREQQSSAGIRDRTALEQLANSIGFAYTQMIDMPANNCLLVWRKPAEPA